MMMAPPAMLRVNFGARLDLMQLFAEAYADAAECDAPMRIAADAFEAIREGIKRGDVLEILSLLDYHVGRSFGSPLQAVVIRVRARVRAALADSLVGRGAGDDASAQSFWREVGGALIGHLESEFLRELLSKCPADSRLDDLRATTQLISKRRWADAHDLILSLREAVESSGTQALLDMLLGQIQLFHFVYYQKARAYLERASTLAPLDSRILGALGQWHEAWGDRARAKSEFYLQQVARDPHDVDGYLNLGRALLAEGDPTGAEAQFQQAIEAAPGEEGGYQELIDLYGQADIYAVRADSIRGLRDRMLVLYPHLKMDAILNEALTHRLNKRYDAARSTYYQALAVDPDCYEAIIGLGLCALDESELLSSDDPHQASMRLEARTAFQRAIDLDPKAWEGYWDMSFQAAKEGNIDEALALCERMVAACHPDWTVACLCRAGSIKREARHYDEAEEDLLRCLQLDQGNRDALSVLVELADDRLYVTADRDAATRLYEVVRDGWGAVAPEVYENRIGNLHFYHGDFALAAECYRRAIAARPTDPVLRSNLAEALVSTSPDASFGDALEEAVSALRQAVSLDPSVTGRVQLLEETQNKLACWRRYGVETFTLRPDYPPVLVELDTDVAPLVLAEGGPSLRPEVQSETELMQGRLEEHFGLMIPATTFGATGRPGGKISVVVDGEPDNWSTRIEARAPDAVAALFSAVEDRLSQVLDRLTTIDTVAKALDGREAPSCSEIRTDMRLLTRFTFAVRPSVRAGELAGEKLVMRADEFLKAEAGKTDSTALTVVNEQPADVLLGSAPGVNLVIGEGLAKHRKAVAEAARLARLQVFELSGVLVPEIAPIVERALRSREWKLAIGEQARSGRVQERSDAALTTSLSQQLSRDLQSLAASMFSRQLLEHYLTLLADQRPVLVETALELVGIESIAHYLASWLSNGGSIRNLPVLLSGRIAQAVI